jgi:hypothetical protein
VFTPPGPTYATLVAIANAGALLGQNYPNAVYYNGVTYFGYNNGDNGNIEVRTYTHATGVTSAATVVDAGLEIETHDPPALLMRASDHKLMVFYMKHSATVAYLKVASSAESIAAFGARVSLHTSLGATDYTYPTVHQLTGLANSPIYLFFRDDNTTGTNGTRASLAYSVSTDDGATWSTRVKVHAPTTERPYWMVRSNGVDRIDVFLCQDDRAHVDNVRLWRARCPSRTRRSRRSIRARRDPSTRWTSCTSRTGSRSWAGACGSPPPPPAARTPTRRAGRVQLGARRWCSRAGTRSCSSRAPIRS